MATKGTLPGLPVNVERHVEPLRSPREIKHHLLRSTLVNLYLRCPRAYKLRIRGKLPDPPNVWGQLGNAAHQYAAAVLLDQPDPMKGVYETLPLELATDWPAIKLAADHALAKINRDELVGVEETQEWHYVFRRRHYLVRGTIDALEIEGEFATVHDFKSGWGVPSKDDLERDTQLLMYALLVVRTWPLVQRVRVQQLQLRFDRAVWAQFDREQIEAWSRTLQETGHRMVSDKVYAPSPLCDVCPPGVHQTAIAPYRSWDVQLAKGAFKVSLPPVTDEVSAQAVASATRFAEALSRAGRAKLREWAFAHGPVVVGPGAYAHYYVPDVRPTDIADIVNKLTPDEQRKYLRIDGTKRPELLRDRPELAEFFTEEGTTKFDFRLAKKEQEEQAS